MSARITFTKMHGLGNDFVVINNIDQNIEFSPALIIEISDRHRGVGCDQVLVLEKLPEKDIEPNIDFSTAYLIQTVLK
jgi:diaminopimelate epimerase